MNKETIDELKLLVELNSHNANVTQAVAHINKIINFYNQPTIKTETDDYESEPDVQLCTIKWIKWHTRNFGSSLVEARDSMHRKRAQLETQKDNT